MIVTRDVIVDLIPLYLAGEASPGTRILVAEYLAQDVELAEQVRRQQREERAGMNVAAVPDLELRALMRTRRLIRLRGWFFGLAWFFTALSFSVQMEITPNGVQRMHLVLFDLPLVFGPIIALAVIFWVSYVALRRRTRIGEY